VRVGGGVGGGGGGECGGGLFDDCQSRPSVLIDGLQEKCQASTLH